MTTILAGQVHEHEQRAALAALTYAADFPDRCLIGLLTTLSPANVVAVIKAGGLHDGAEMPEIAAGYLSAAAGTLARCRRRRLQDAAIVTHAEEARSTITACRQRKLGTPVFSQFSPDGAECANWTAGDPPSRKQPDLSRPRRDQRHQPALADSPGGRHADKRTSRPGRRGGPVHL